MRAAEHMIATGTCRPFATDHARSEAWPLALIAGTVLVGLFADGIVAGRFLGVRDSLHFFPPLYRLVASEWKAGRAPLWNPWLNGGQPLAATNTAGVFYPPQLLCTALLPDGLSLDALMIGHVILAGAAAYRLARDGGSSPAGAFVSSLAFAGAGSVLFHVYAPNALAGAAWAAWAMQAGLALFRHPTSASFLGLAVALAMTVLAGDPQSAFHAGISLGVVLCSKHSWRRSRPRNSTPADFTIRSGVVALAVVLAGLLALVQLALTREYMLSTTRYADLAPISLWDVPGFLWRATPMERQLWSAVLIGRPPPGLGFYHDMYRYSAAPWRIIECLSPTLSGSFMNRWPRASGWEGDVWVATLYAGMVPVGCAVLAVVVPAIRRRARMWMTLLAFSYIAAVGGFGLSGAIRHACARALGTGDVIFYTAGDEVGGLYWLLATFVPGYSGFRYPAKWLAIFALAFSQLAACGFDFVIPCARKTRFISHLYVGLAAASLVLTAGAIALAGEEAMFVAIGGAVAVAAAGAASLVTALVHRGFMHRRSARLTLVVIFAIESVIVGRLFLDRTPFASLLEGGKGLDRLRELRLPVIAEASAIPRLAAIDNAILLPDTGNPGERARLTGMAMRGQTPYLHGWAKVGEAGTTMDSDLELFFRTPLNWKDRGVFARRIYDASAVEFFVVPRSPSRRAPLLEFERDWSALQRQGKDMSPLPAGGTMSMAVTPDDGFVRYVRNESAEPRARIVRSVRHIKPLSTLSERLRRLVLRDIAFPNPLLPTLGPTAVVESTAPFEISRIQEHDTADGESCRIILDEPRRVKIDVKLAAPGLVVLADTFHADWSLRVSIDGGPARDWESLRVNHIHRGCLLPAGNHVIEYGHLSKTFDRTWPISATAWVAVLAFATVLATRRRGSVKGCRNDTRRSVEI